MKIWLDDERDAPEGWTRVYTIEQLQTLLRTNKVTDISLDHDLGDGNQTGYDFLNWLEAQVFIGKWKNIPELKIHSANPVGRKNMEAAIGSIKNIIQNNLSGDK